MKETLKGELVPASTSPKHLLSQNGNGSMSSNNSLKTAIKLVVKAVTRKLYRLPQKIFYKIKENLNKKILHLNIKLSIKHIHGPLKIEYEKDELIVTCLVRNGEIYIASFIQYHLMLGVKHIVFLDNGSTDRTVKIAQTYKNVTILQSLCPYSKYETSMKKYLVNRFSKNRWNLFVDIDEFFDYPFSNLLNMKDFLNYLNRNSYTAVVSQMLDMFSDKSLSDLEDPISDDIKGRYSYYDISQISPSKYGYGHLENEKIKMHYGGIRKILFGTDNGLTKAALVFVDKKNNLFADWHHVTNAKLADFTCVLLHYPFTSSFYNKVMDAIETNRYALSASHEYAKYWDRIRTNQDFTIKRATSSKLNGLPELIDKGFLVVSDRYIQWINDIQISSRNF